MTDTDPVAAKSAFLRMYMSNHPDTLVAYAKWYGKVTEAIKGAEMASIDTKGMTLTCTLKDGGKKDVYIPIVPPLGGYEDVKPRLLEMKALAQENLGMIKAPQINTFRIPSGIITSGFVVGAVFYLYLSPKDGSSPFIQPAKLAHETFGSTPINFAAYTVGFLHVLESVYTYSLCRRHKSGFFTTAAYVLSTLLFGFPIWVDLRRRIQSARIDSVMKIE